MSVTAQLDTMSDRELVAYWNIMQFPGLVVGSRNAEHLPIVDGLLSERGIAHERGSRTAAAQPAA